MIKTLEIKNFKSIKHLKLDCKRVNVLIGKPNTGKSNILESAGIFSLPYAYANLKDIVRFENMTNLFHDQDVSEKIEISTEADRFEITFENGWFKVNSEDREGKIKIAFECGYDGRGDAKKIKIASPRNVPFKFYRFTAIDRFDRPESDFLTPPKGENLLQILLTNKEARKMASDIFSEYGLKILLRTQEFKIEVQKEVEEVIVSYPYALVSDTLQRVVFHLVAIETNKDSIIIFEEPEAHSFPYYTKFLAERIALDESNQYFISTHNPYFLLSVLEKISKDDIGIVITYLDEFQTKIKALIQEEMPEILDLDASVFFNLDRFWGKP
ncbi:MAG: AAA family ATPase [candidate division KSB1 bacterium]|nr:AAA family ATPase [candidate division KSB1 bacterium]